MTFHATAERAYVCMGGGACPSCGSRDVERTGRQEVEGNQISQLISCDGCGASWKDVHTLTSVSDFESGLVKDIKAVIAALETIQQGAAALTAAYENSADRGWEEDFNNIQPAGVNGVLPSCAHEWMLEIGAWKEKWAELLK